MNFKDYINNFQIVIDNLDFNSFNDGAKILNNFFKKEKKIFICGNGGSAVNASHYVTDWSKFIPFALHKKIIFHCLSDNIGSLTAAANDYNYDDVFKLQLENSAKKGDLLICISGSGNSKNLISAVNYAKKKGVKTFGILGFDGGKLKKKCDYIVHVPSYDMQICEDIHLMFGHFVMRYCIEK